MTYVVTESCIRCKYTDCVDVCPVDCFREGPNFLVIDPDECIDCTLCVAECPVEAIYAEDDVPPDQQALAAPSLAWAQGALNGDPAAGARKTQMCRGCHGIDGWRTAYPEVYGVPKVGGQHQVYIVKALQAYKSGERSHPSMKAIAATLSDQDMADLAGYDGAAPAKTASNKEPPRRGTRPYPC